MISFSCSNQSGQGLINSFKNFPKETNFHGFCLLFVSFMSSISTLVFIYLFGHAVLMRDLSSLPRDQTQAPTVKAQSPNHQTIRDGPLVGSFTYCEFVFSQFLMVKAEVTKLRPFLFSNINIQHYKFPTVELVASNKFDCVFIFIQFKMLSFSSNPS